MVQLDVHKLLRRIKKLRIVRKILQKAAVVIDGLAVIFHRMNTHNVFKTEEMDPVDPLGITVSQVIEDVFKIHRQGTGAIIRDAPVSSFFSGGNSLTDFRENVNRSLRFFCCARDFGEISLATGARIRYNKDK